MKRSSKAAKSASRGSGGQGGEAWQFQTALSLPHADWRQTARRPPPARIGRASDPSELPCLPPLPTPHPCSCADFSRYRLGPALSCPSFNSPPLPQPARSLTRIKKVACAHHVRLTMQPFVATRRLSSTRPPARIWSDAPEQSSPVCESSDHGQENHSSPYHPRSCHS